MSESQRPIELFYSYAQPDEALREEIEKHLSHLVQQRQITPWYQHKILPGTYSVQEIDRHLNTAQIILLLISSDFLASDYCYRTETQRAIERHKAQSACVIPILLRPVDWEGTPFAELEPLPSNRKPITSWSNQDEALRDVALGIRRALEKFKALPAGVQQEVRPVEQPAMNQPPASNGLQRWATVFFSYAHEDTELVRDLQLRINVRGIASWRDVDDLPTGSLVEGEIIRAIEHDADAIALFLTPSCLQSDFIWRVEVPAALRRHKRDPHFHIVPLLQGISFAEVQQFCYNRKLADLSRFNGIVLADGTTSETKQEQNKKRNDVARRILQDAFALHLRRIHADHSYEPSIYLRTFVSAPRSIPDLSLDWQKVIDGKEHIPTAQEWEEILWPALLDVKRTISEKIPSHRIHLFIKGILPVAIALGFVFRETCGIALLLEGQKEIWSTETSPSEQELLHCEWTYNDQGDQQIAVIGVATTLSIKQSISETLSVVNFTPAYCIQLESSELSGESVRDAAHARAIAQQVRHICRKLCDQQRVRQIHLFVAIPVELAVLIGHQLNALCSITLYEYSKGSYQPIGGLS